MRERVTTVGTVACLLVFAFGVGAQWGWEFGLMVFGLLGACVSEAAGMKGESE